MSLFHKSDRPLEYWPLESMDAPRHLPGYWTRRLEVALTMLIVFALVVWAVSR